MKKAFSIICIGIFVIAAANNIAFAYLDYQEVYNSTAGSKHILILVNGDIYESVQSSIEQYTMDLEAEDYQVTVTTIPSSAIYRPRSFIELRDYLKSFPDLVGALLIGNLPIPYYEGSDEPVPCDLYYMDLDGIWIDSNNNYYPDGRDFSSDYQPEIWIGRLTPSLLKNPNMDEAEMIRNYFVKNHNYRLGLLTANNNALVYEDDDFIGLGIGSVRMAYPDPVWVNERPVTSAEDYKKRITEGYEFLHLGTDSVPAIHNFIEGDGANSFVYSHEIRDIDPVVLFYGLNTCYSCRYVSSDYLGGYYIFARNSGLCAVGATAPLGIDTNFDNFYALLGPGSRSIFGEALKALIVSNQDEDRVLTLLGDPTLSLDPPIPHIESIQPPAAKFGQSVTFNGFGTIRDGSIIGYAWRSDKDGSLSEDRSFMSDTLSVGNHTIFFKVRDDKGRWSSEAKSTLSIALARDEISIELEGSLCIVRDIAPGDIRGIVTEEGKSPVLINNGIRDVFVDVRLINEAGSGLMPGTQQDVDTYVVWIYTSMGRMPIPSDSSLLLGTNIASGDVKAIRAEFGAPTKITNPDNNLLNLICEFRAYPIMNKLTITIPPLPRNDMISKIKRVFIKNGR